MNAKFDRYYPVAIGGVCALCYYIMFRYFWTIPENMKELVTASATISSIAVGFLATAKATLISMNNTKVVEWMKSGGVYLTTIDYFMDAIHWCLATAVISGVLMLANFKSITFVWFWLMSVWVFFAVSAFFSTYRIIRLFATILRHN